MRLGERRVRFELPDTRDGVTSESTSARGLPVEVYGAAGALVARTRTGSEVDLTGAPAGAYVARVALRDGRAAAARFVLP